MLAAQNIKGKEARRQVAISKTFDNYLRVESVRTMAITDVDRIGLLIGAGSMGKRHAKVLAQKYPKVIVVDRDPALEAWVMQELRQQDMFVPDVESALSKVGANCGQVTAIIATLGPDHVATFNRLVDAGVKRILCEKPLSNSLANARQMVDRSVRDNVRFTVGLQRRRSGLVPQLLEAAEKHLGGLPVAIVGHGGAHCLMTTGMHWIDLAIDIFGEAPTSVTALAEPDMINPRGKDLEMWAGVAGWSFSRGRYLSLTYSNLSSVEGTLHMYCPTGRLDVAPSGDWQMYRRDAEQIKNDPRITRVGEASFQPDFVVANPTVHPTLVALDELDSDCELSYTSQDALVSLDAAIGALISAQTNKAVSFPITVSDLVAKEWAVS